MYLGYSLSRDKGRHPPPLISLLNIKGRQQCIGNHSLYNKVEECAQLSENSNQFWSADVLVSAPSAYIQRI